jgi:hypothetical protein
MRQYIPAVAITGMAVVFNIALQKGHFLWFPDWALALIWIVCLLVWLWHAKAVRELVAYVYGSATSGILDASAQPVIRRRISKRTVTWALVFMILGVTVLIVAWEAHQVYFPLTRLSFTSLSPPKAAPEAYNRATPSPATQRSASTSSGEPSLIRAGMSDYQLPHLRSLIHQMAITEMWISQVLDRGKDAFYDVPGRGMIDYPAAVRVLANQGSITVLESATRKYKDFYGEVFTEDIRFKLSGGMYDDLTAKEMGTKAVGLCNQINQFLIKNESYDAFSFMDGRDQAQQARTPEEEKKLRDQATRAMMTHADNAEIEFDEKFGFQITTLRSALLSRLSDTQKKSYENNRLATDSDYQRPLWNSWSAKAVCQDLNQLAGMLVAAAFQNDADQSAQPTNVRVASQENVQSPYPQMPYALRIVLQTSISIQPVSLAFECDGDIGQGAVSLGSDQVFRAYNPKIGLLSAKVYGVSFSLPAFTPDKPMVITLYSKERIKMTRWEVTPFSRP